MFKIGQKKEAVVKQPLLILLKSDFTPHPELLLSPQLLRNHQR